MLQFGDRARRYDSNFVSYLCGIAWVVREILLGAHEILLVLRVLHIAIHADRGSILHSRLHDDSDERLGTNSFLFHTYAVACPDAFGREADFERRRLCSVSARAITLRN